MRNTVKSERKRRSSISQMNAPIIVINDGSNH